MNTGIIIGIVVAVLVVIALIVLGLVLSLDDKAAPCLHVFGGKITTYRRLAEAAMAKMTATENAQRVIDMALQMHGGRGVEVGAKVESLYRDIRSLRIYEGASEVQKIVVGRQHLAAANG